jgi:hypothetical protein
MSRVFGWALLCAITLPLGQLAGQIEARREKPERNEVEVRFVDGSKVRMTVLQESLEVVTKYGKLVVPIKDIRNIEFGLHLPEEITKQVELAVKRLGSNAHADREAASRELVALSYQAYPALHAAIKSRDPEVVRRAEEAIKRIQDKVPAHLLRLNTNDHVETVEFPINGRISSTGIKATSVYFGDKEVRIADLVALHALGLGGVFEVTVDAAKYGSAAFAWLETGVEIDADMPLLITASGQVDLWEDGTGQYMTGPGGYKGQAVGAPGVRVRVGLAGGGGGGGNLPGGALVGKIGESGETFLIGENYRGKAARQGKLYLHIVPSPWGNPSVGSYKVKVNAGGTP